MFSGGGPELGSWVSFLPPAAAAGGQGASATVRRGASSALAAGRPFTFASGPHTGHTGPRAIAAETESRNQRLLAHRDACRKSSHAAFAALGDRV
jgi:hypothetical protein